MKEMYLLSVRMQIVMESWMKSAKSFKILTKRREICITDWQGNYWEKKNLAADSIAMGFLKG
jgi:hypothetical protein